MWRTDLKWRAKMRERLQDQIRSMGERAAQEWDNSGMITGETYRLLARWNDLCTEHSYFVFHGDLRQQSRGPYVFESINGGVYRPDDMRRAYEKRQGELDEIRRLEKLVKEETPWTIS